MPLRPGDTVSLSIRPPIQLSQFQYLKTGVTLTRVVGENPEADIADMRVTAQRLYAEALHMELTTFDTLTQIYAEGDMDDLVSWCVEQSRGLEEEHQEGSHQEGSHQASPKGGAKGTTSGKSKSTVRKARGKTIVRKVVRKKP